MADENPLPGSPPGTPGGPHSPPAVSPNHAPKPLSAAPKPPPPQILLNPGSRPVSSPKPPDSKAPEEVKDSFRELVETVVFVVVLVLLLKTFLAEAFVIPTGSMATTLLGYHYKVPCQQCGYPNLVNASSEADPQEGFAQPVISCQCINCGFTNELRRVVPRGGQP